MSDTPDNAGEHELELPVSELELVELPALVLRDFTYRLRPRHDAAGRVHGIALDVLAKTGLPLQLTLLFERTEFVNMATAGLAGLDDADNAGAAGPTTEGR